MSLGGLVSSATSGTIATLVGGKNGGVSSAGVAGWLPFGGSFGPAGSALGFPAPGSFPRGLLLLPRGGSSGGWAGVVAATHWFLRKEMIVSSFPRSVSR